jgi:signal transduction histidine kinase
VQEITERKRANEAIKSLNAQLTADMEILTRMQQVRMRLVQADNFARFLDEILDAATAIAGSDLGNIQLLEQGALKIVTHRGFEAPFLDFFDAVHKGQAAWGTAMQAAQRVVIKDVADSPIFAGTPALEVVLASGARSVQCTPLVSRSVRVLGMVSTHWRHAPHRPTERQQQMLDVLARQAADLIERQQAEQALRHQREQFETLLNRAPLGMFLVDADFRIAQGNPIAILLFGEAGGPAGVTGCDFDEIVHLLWPEERADELVRRFRHTLQTGESYSNPEYIEPRRDRNNIIEYYEWRIDRITLPDGRFGVACYFRDISLQVQTREVLKDADRRKDEFLATLAHELRNPLAPIRNSLHILRLAGSDSGAAERVREMMERQVGQMVRLVDDLMEVSRITRGKIELRKERVELAGIIRSAVETSKPLIEAARHQLAISLPAEPLILEADPIRLAQVLANLLNSAAKYTEEAGQIRITARREGSSAVVSVRDSGV